MAALGYDSAMILADAIKRAGTTDGAKVRDALAATKDFPGVTGKITIDANRNASKSAVILTIKNGQFKYVEDDRAVAAGFAHSTKFHRHAILRAVTSGVANRNFAEPA